MDFVNFYLPDFYSNVNLICFFADLLKETPECFYDNVKITSAYGCFPNSIWNGGRVFFDSIMQDQMKMVIEQLNKRDIRVRYTFTNPLIVEKHLQDTFCNLALELADNGMNEVLVNSPILEEYIRKTYPNYALISSTTKCLDRVDQLEAELEKDYSLVVIDSALNNTPELFEMKNRDRMELIVDHFCADNCPRRRAHYIAQGEAMLAFRDSEIKTCNYANREFFQVMGNRSFITVDALYGKYYEAGFRHFKLDGRGFAARKVIDSFLYYLVKPEWQDKMRQIILREIYKF